MKKNFKFNVRFTVSSFGILSTFLPLLERELMKDKEGYPINIFQQGGKKTWKEI